jgi:hypothetical protein
MNELTPLDMDAFDVFMRSWQGKLGLDDWRIVRSLKKPRKGVMAEVLKRDLGQRLASYRVGMSFGATEVSPHSLEQTAVHELLHVLLFELIELAKDENTPAVVLESAEHRVINILERLLVPPKK